MAKKSPTCGAWLACSSTAEGEEARHRGKLQPSPFNAAAIISAPPIIIKFVLLSLARMGFAPEQIITTLEMKMRCGLGKCGRCNVGPAYVCRHGPVFSFAELQRLPNEC